MTHPRMSEPTEAPVTPDPEPVNPGAGQPTTVADNGAADPTARAADDPGQSSDGPSREELTDRWRRAVAELENLRKRMGRQVIDARRTERGRATEAWLPVLDHLEMALAHADADPATIVAGVRAVCQQAQSVLSALGYRRIGQVGDQFDPTMHEAAQVVQSNDSAPGTVVAVLRPGYGTEDMLLRPAMVTVAAAPEAG